MEKYLPKIKRTPVIGRIASDSSPEKVYALFADRADTALLNSSFATDAGRYSFIGIDPFLILKGSDGKLSLGFDNHKLDLAGNPFNLLASILDTFKTESPVPLPFTSGGIGYLSYDLKNSLEKLPAGAADELGLPDIYFVFYRTILIFDRQEPGVITASILEMDPDGRKKPSDILKETAAAITKSIVPANEPLSAGRKAARVASNFSKKDYVKAVEKVLDYIRSGDIYQACLSQRFKTTWDRSPYELYLELNKINPAPFSAYLNYDGFQIISSSPELFLRSDGRVVETRPMKGTRPRGRNAEEDLALKDSLEKSEKDGAELSMIVDLQRNDLGRIARPGTVKVAEHKRIEPYPTVFQTISVVKAEIDDGISPVDIIKATFPGGSITGCPKIRAMEIIAELEPVKRSVYTGSIGYISFHNTMNLSIAIRTMIMKGKDVYFHAGGGIVADSDPLSEYEETLAKAQAMITSLQGTFHHSVTYSNKTT
ncbi:MAG: aminodeoxychorismate synthase component I [Candidatus Omnitrophota bacterium]